MKPLLDSNGLDRRPHHVTPECWYYEEPDGLRVYFNGRFIGTIKWRALQASLKRKVAARSPRSEIVNG